jgi:hypothetical protein
MMNFTGMKIRFSNLIKGLRQIGDDVMVITPCINPPKTFHGAKVRAAHCYISHLGAQVLLCLPVSDN